jgi:hypothetical protein
MTSTVSQAVADVGERGECFYSFGVQFSFESVVVTTRDLFGRDVALSQTLFHLGVRFR